jgi:plasmid stability protein
MNLLGRVKVTLLVLRDLDEIVLDRLKERARQNRRSLQGEIKVILEASAASCTRVEVLGTLHGWQEHSGQHRVTVNAELIRDDRCG